MAITLDSLVRNPAAGQQAGVPVSTKADLATGAFDIAGKSIGQQMNATSVQLSPFGQVKSSFVDVQSAGRTLTTPAKTSTVEDTTKAVQSFADAYNNATKVVNAAIQSGSNSANALAGGGGYASLASDSLKKIVSSGNTSTNLKNIGVGVNQDGTLSVDANTLQSAVQSNPASVRDTLFSVGAQAGQVSGQLLNGTGNAGGTINTFSNRARNTGTGGSKSPVGSQNPVRQQSVNAGNGTGGGIAVYMQMASL